MKWLQFVVVSVLAAFSAFADVVTRETEWQDVPSETKVGTVLDLVDVGVDTNAVRDIAREEIVPATNSIVTTLIDSTNRLYTAITNAMPYGSARPLPKYLHALEFDDCYAEDAAWYYAQRNAEGGGCSAVRDGNFFYRNFDFPLDERAEFVVKVSAGAGRYASVGVAQVGTNLTEEAVTSGKPSRYYKCLPGATVDGINEKGVVACINVSSGTNGWRKTGEVHVLGAVRWVLDNAKSASDAARALAEKVYIPEGFGGNFHFLVADRTATYVVENGTRYPYYSDRPVMTNFQLYPSPVYGDGWERYAMLTNTGVSVTNAWFTRAYSRDTNWVSEFADAEEMAAAKAAWASLGTKEARRATGAFWQTVHTSVYDITNKTLFVAAQETDDWYVFAVPSAGGVKSVNGYTGDVTLYPSDIGAVWNRDGEYVNGRLYFDNTSAGRATGVYAKNGAQISADSGADISVSGNGSYLYVSSGAQINMQTGTGIRMIGNAGITMANGDITMAGGTLSGKVSGCVTNTMENKIFVTMTNDFSEVTLADYVAKRSGGGLPDHISASVVTNADGSAISGAGRVWADGRMMQLVKPQGFSYHVPMFGANGPMLGFTAGQLSGDIVQLGPINAHWSNYTAESTPDAMFVWPNNTGVLAVESWASLNAALATATNAAARQATCAAICKATESAPHIVKIGNEYHIVTITETSDNDTTEEE